jgi:hypothetical protein
MASRIYLPDMDIGTCERLARTIGVVHFERFDALGKVRIEREGLMPPAALRGILAN